ncbi:expressed protein [Chlorella variabilis]|uniref:Expressed protein n=1 Tax=Chlorella variabilis TaxID=554065 RepID=E1ZLY8_CHLVA|nr:expressed protein [Chlorella variabilis]EFN53350.1 expressed protein [Chlorella variabilis]|eukprot:XP_005845452.1 expressed protein [Chlorella variabilis]
MLALVSGSSANSGAGGSSGGGGDRSAELAEFAGMVVRAVREEVGCGGTQLAQLARYLLLLHQHQHHTGFHPFWWPNFSAQTQRLCGQLLLPQRDALPPAALEPADGGRRLPAGGVREHDVQALRTSLGCDREEAVALLRRNGGCAFRGLQDAGGAHR